MNSNSGPKQTILPVIHKKGRGPSVPIALLEQLVARGVDSSAAKRVLGALLRGKVDKHSGETLREPIGEEELIARVTRQIAWMPYKTGVINQAAYLMTAIQFDFSMPARMEQIQAKEQLVAANQMLRALEAMLEAAEDGKVLGWRPSKYLNPLPVMGFDDQIESTGPVALVEFPDGKVERLPIKRNLKIESWVYMEESNRRQRSKKR